MTNSPSQSEAQPEVSEDTPVEAESGKGWSPNVSRRRIIVAVFVILAGVFAALYACAQVRNADADNRSAR